MNVNESKTISDVNFKTWQHHCHRGHWDTRPPQMTCGTSTHELVDQQVLLYTFRLPSVGLCPCFLQHVECLMPHTAAICDLSETCVGLRTKKHVLVPQLRYGRGQILNLHLQQSELLLYTSSSLGVFI
jgi:hypothetical protein